jgi:hypothetical protein
LEIQKEKAVAREGLNNEPEWRFVPLSEHSLPTAPSRESLSWKAHNLIAHLRFNPIAGNPSLDRATLAAVPPVLMERVAPQPDWQFLVHALEDSLGEWLSKANYKFPIRIVVGAPFSGIPEALTLWAKQKKWRLVDGPNYLQIMDSPRDWVEQFKHNRNMPFVIPQFEKLFLRHHAGLMLARQMLNWLMQRQKPCLIGINSWSYAYLCKVLQLEALKVQPITLAACSPEHLSKWFRSMSSGIERIGIVFRQSDTGKFVLPPNGDHPTEKRSNDLAPFLKYLSVHTHGNPGVAWRIWRHSLHYDVDEGVGEKAQSLAESDHGRTMWVKAWSQIDLPQTPAVHLDLFVLHSLLLHGSLSFTALTKTLSMFDVS